MSRESTEAAVALDGDSPLSHSPVRHPSISLQAAATLNASLQRESPSRGSPNSPLSPSQRSPSSSRRRSQVLMNLQIADPSVPAPGEMVSDNNNHQQQQQQASSPHTVSASPRLIASRGPHPPHHDRVPSLGELHQELESEQEFQVNRLLAEIRRLQEQVQRHQSQSSTAVSGDGGDDNASGTTTAPVPIPTAAAAAATGATSSSVSSSLPLHPSSGSLPRSPGFPRSSFDRHRSRTPSRHASPRHRATSISADSVGEGFQLGGGGNTLGRDESTYYQAEAQMLVRENQILRQRIRELERQLCDAQGSNPSSMTHEPSQPSHLNRSVSVSEEDPAKQPAAQ